MKLPPGGIPRPKPIKCVHIEEFTKVYPFKEAQDTRWYPGAFQTEVQRRIYERYQAQFDEPKPYDYTGDKGEAIRERISPTPKPETPGTCWTIADSMATAAILAVLLGMLATVLFGFYALMVMI